MLIKSFTIESNILKDNPLKDPSVRKLYSIEVGDVTQAPIVIYLSGFFSSSITLLNYDPLSESINEKLERLHKEGKVKNLIFILPDLFTKLGGNQYINSSAVGMYEDFIIKELIPYLFDVYGKRDVILMGKSSGGYGSIVLAMKYPEVISGLIDHSGDSYFEYVYLPYFPHAIRHIRREGSLNKWLEKYWSKENKKDKDDLNTLNIIAMAAFYSPEGTEIVLPFDLDTGEIIEDVWKKWLEKDPVRLVEKYADNLKKLRLIYLDVGNKDEFRLNFGMRILHKKMLRYNVKHEFEEYEGGHFNTSYRYDISISLISKVFNGDNS
ncbi:alpha/beta hydrolase-fold protein [Sulfurisphaera ohwakuensis]|uniref:S-formylglutathione hydrolase n=1 Tax=Sulfurisphaera ohwakuensis TaxID=69656 RepID=A0A650CJ19_SULOH|nr:alpha/beta hydrolase-fold protein [Sulfurisphaera ohwakuensis]MBB5253342.1 pimeloyl-ACP methyl ester carboxylesterase [Sulfurisphaera ohwakuensis]QGR17665.1 esterase [Sulfurisphaera ohwakuensis]